MTIASQCPSCKRRFGAPDHLLGKGVKCPQCGNQFIVQAAAPAAAIQAPSATGAAPTVAGEPARSQTAVKARGGFPVKAALIAVLVLLVAGGLYAGYTFFLAGGVGWNEFASKEGGFSVLLPGTPDPKGKTDAKITSGNIQEIVQPARSSTLSVHYYDLPYKPINDYLYISFLKHTLLAEKSGSKLAREQEVALGNYTGREIVVDLPDDQVVARRVYLANARVFWLTAQYPKSAVHPWDAQKFFDSFQITSAPPLPANPNLVASSGPGFKLPDSFDLKLDGPPKTKTDPKVDPPLTKVDPPKIDPKAGFPIGADEQTLLELINRFRVSEKTKPFRAEKRLFDGARTESAALAKKAAIKATDYGYTRIFRLTLPGRDITPQELVAQLLLLKSFKTQLADEEFDDIGIGISKGKDGVIYYLILIGGNPR